MKVPERGDSVAVGLRTLNWIARLQRCLRGCFTA
jgi:hypothetical protein